MADLEEELGDLLFQVYFHAILAAEAGRFTLADVARGVHDKLVSRHPHVFGDVVADTADEVADQLGGHQEGGEGPDERDRGHPGRPAVAGPGGQAAAQGGGHRDGAAGRGRRGGPGRRGGGRTRAGADPVGGAADGVVADGEGGARARAEAVGDLLFALVDVARALGVDPETALLARAAGVPGRGRGSRAERRRSGPAGLCAGRIRRIPRSGRVADGSFADTANRSDDAQ